MSFSKSRALNSVYVQMSIIVFAFVIMGVSSFIFVSRIERRHLLNDVDNALIIKETELIADLMEPETFLTSYIETIRNMLLRGDEENIITEYIVSVTNFLIRNRDYMSGFSNSHGFFFKWDGKYISGRNWTVPENFSPVDAPWYQIAIDARGGIVISDPYKDLISGNTILTFSQYITDDYGNPLAVICIDIDLVRLISHANINLTKSSYGILINKNQDILAHQDRNLLGFKLYNTNIDIAGFSYLLSTGNILYNHRINKIFDNKIVFSAKVKYDWILAIVIPENEYYQSIIYMAIFLTVIGLALAFGLCAMMNYISQARIKSDIRTKQKSNFLATMSHEIRTPLNAIMGITEIQIQNSIHSPSASEAFFKINNSGKLLLNIINDILDLSKIELGKLELNPVKYEVASLINDIIQLNYIRYEDKPINFIIDVDDNTPAILVGDELRIKQILNNLLSNAFKYTDKGDVRLTVNAECVGRGGGAVIVTLIFKVEDTGQGMTLDQVDKLFDEYTRFNLEANRTTEGAGLGMTITRNLIEMMYGNINVKSKFGEGTSITVRLPQKTDGVGIRGIIGKQTAENLKQLKQIGSLQQKRMIITHEYMPYGNILIVDDVETNLYVAQGLMAPYGLKIDLASSGFEAVEKIKEGRNYDIIFMDHMMPKMDGIETTQIIRKMEYTRPIVALTANAIAGQIEMFLNSGFDDFISKPIDIRLLNVLLNRLIRDKQPKEVIEAAQKEKAEMNSKSDPAFETRQTVNLQLLEVFARDAQKAAENLNLCLKNNLNCENDIQMYIINVHSMKSALANIRETKLSSAAQRLEQAGRENNINVMLSETGNFINDLNKVIDGIKSKIKEKEITEDTDESLAFLYEKMEIIKEACEVLNKKAIKNAITELKEKQWSNPIKEKLNLISEYLLHSEFEKITAIADKIK